MGRADVSVYKENKNGGVQVLSLNLTRMQLVLAILSLIIGIGLTVIGAINVLVVKPMVDEAIRAEKTQLDGLVNSRIAQHQDWAKTQVGALVNELRQERASDLEKQRVWTEARLANDKADYQRELSRIQDRLAALDSKSDRIYNLLVRSHGGN